MSNSVKPLPTGIVTFLLTDIEGSTQAWQASPDSMTSLVSRHYEILESGIAAHHGRRPEEQGDGDKGWYRTASCCARVISERRRV